MNVSVDNACMLQALTQHVIPSPHGRPDLVANDTYHDFLKTQPPIFLKAEEPLEIEDWIRTIETIEQKFSLIHCSDVQKTLFVGQQLQGPTDGWWARFLATQPEGHQVPWADFCTAFRKQYIPDGVRGRDGTVRQVTARRSECDGILRQIQLVILVCL